MQSYSRDVFICLRFDICSLYFRLLQRIRVIVSGFSYAFYACMSLYSCNCKIIRAIALSELYPNPLHVQTENPFKEHMQTVQSQFREMDSPK